MGLLRIHPDSYDVLDAWWFSADASPADRNLIHDLLSDLEAGGLPATSCYREDSPVNRTWTNLIPRDGLVVVVEMFTDDPSYFRIVSITTLTRHPDA